MQPGEVVLGRGPTAARRRTPRPALWRRQALPAGHRNRNSQHPETPGAHGFYRRQRGSRRRQHGPLMWMAKGRVVSSLQEVIAALIPGRRSRALLTISRPGIKQVSLTPEVGTGPGIPAADIPSSERRAEPLRQPVRAGAVGGVSEPGEGDLCAQAEGIPQIPNIYAPPAVRLDLRPADVALHDWTAG